MLDAGEVAVLQDRNSRKEAMSDADARKLLASADTVIIARGKASRTIPASQTKLADLRGPTGNFRAPMIRKGRTLLVGFSDAELRRLLHLKG